MQRLSETTVPAPLNLHEDLSPAVEADIQRSVANATAADFLLSERFLKDIGCVGKLDGEVIRWSLEFRDQTLIDVLQLPNGWRISPVTAGNCTHCGSPAQTALVKVGDGASQIILLCDTHEREALDHA